ncbi:phytanoyl-CoA dioxygenase family protein [Bradyrhizobium sp. LjRoot220]|uniref:phytanoyl-CoA dioxygenase family protein n=1 Tax=Bradyrhizobium sp. LjRoot220 TaxID=3342284 RepID=UPI003ECFB168
MMDNSPPLAGKRPVLPIDGYVTLRGWLAGSDVAQLRRLVEETKKNPAQGCAIRPGNDLVSLRWSNPIVATILGNRTAMSDLQAALHGGELKWISAYISTMRGGSLAVPWHQDWWCWDHPVSYSPQSTQVALLCYLTHVGRDNGALRVIPGSHLRQTALHAALPLPEECFGLSSDHPAVSDHPDSQMVAVAPGDAVVLDYRVLHGASPNRAFDDRDVIILCFTPDWSAVPPDIRSHLGGHYALPSAAETEKFECSYQHLIARHDGDCVDLPLRRQPPFHWS